MPTRIQRKRTKGWRKPENTVIVSRGSRWGNPFTVADCIDAGFAETQTEARVYATETFRQWLAGELDGGPGPAGTSWSRERRDWIRDHVGQLEGRDLMCWCPSGEPCHADVLLELANTKLVEVSV